jgi:hypothetical protein
VLEAKGFEDVLYCYGLPKGLVEEACTGLKAKPLFELYC